MLIASADFYCTRAERRLEIPVKICKKVAEAV